MDEALHVLYVAVTRAKSANYIFLNGYTGQGKKPHQDSYTDILTLALNRLANAGILPSDETEEDGPSLCEWGDPAWHTNANMKAAGAASAAGQALLEQPRPRRRKVSPSKMDAEPSFDGQMGAEGGMLGGGAAASFGTAVHGLFEQVEWLGEGEEPRWVAEPRSDEERLVAAALRVPEVRALYTRRPGQVAYNEQNIDAVEKDKSDTVEKGRWISGTIDRLVLTQQGNQVLAASIIDFKTDLRRGDSPEAQDAHLRETHLSQMRAYHSLICSACELPAESVSVTLVSCPRDGAPVRLVRFSTAELLHS